MKTPEQEPFFTLTAEEVEIVRGLSARFLFKVKNQKRSEDQKKVDEVLDNLLTRIKQWQEHFSGLKSESQDQIQDKYRNGDIWKEESWTTLESKQNQEKQTPVSSEPD